jgi:hypothetical protein
LTDRILAVVSDDAVKVFGSVGVFGFIKTVSPAVESSVASVIAEVKSGNASSIVSTSLFLSFAIFFNTVLRGIENSNWVDFSRASLVTSVGLSTLGDINGGLTSLAGKTESPAAG